MRSKSAFFALIRSVFTLLLVLAMLTIISVKVAYAVGSCNGTAGDDVITCDTNVGEVNLGAGNDMLTLTDGYQADDVLGDRADPAGNDNITINGTVTGSVLGDLVGGDGGDDTILVGSTGEVDGIVAGDEVDGGGGADNITIDGEVQSVFGDISMGNGGNDVITVNGTVNVDVTGDQAWGDGGGGNDVITVNGTVGDDVNGDQAWGDGGGGNDVITVNGTVGDDVNGDVLWDGNGGADIITIEGSVGGNVTGDYTEDGGNGGDDTITINGTVSGDVRGDDVVGEGGNDSITVNGAVGWDIEAEGGDDQVTIGDGAEVGGDINGGDGFDTLTFTFVTQNSLTGLDPASGTLTYEGVTYTWFEFEDLIGLLAEIAAEGGAIGGEIRIVYQGNQILGIADEAGISVIGENGRIAYIPYDAMGDINEGGPLIFQAANSDGWYVVVSELGPNPNNPARDVYLVEIFAAAGMLQTQFTFNY